MTDVLVDHLSNLPDLEDETRPILYACENDHSAVGWCKLKGFKAVLKLPGFSA